MPSSCAEPGARRFLAGGGGKWLRLALVLVMGGTALVAPSLERTGAVFTDSETVSLSIYTAAEFPLPLPVGGDTGDTTPGVAAPGDGTGTDGTGTVGPDPDATGTDGTGTDGTGTVGPGSDATGAVGADPDAPGTIFLDVRLGAARHR